MGLLTVLSGVGADVVGVALGLLTSFGLVGASLLDRFRDDESPGDSPDDDPLLDDGGAFGDDNGDGDDDLGDLGGMDDWDDDDPFGGGEEEEDTAELENRLDDLENEVASLSSTVNTVRSENEEIAGQVEDMAEDVRSLLDIYEMVTRGINPFVDDVQTGGMDGDLAGEGSFGLFDDEDEEEEEELDDELASADAEGFFDEELIDGDDDFDDEELDELDELDDFDDNTETMATENGDGKSFSELKDEYESGDADWVEDGDELRNGADENGSLDLDEEGSENATESEEASTAGPTDPTDDGDGGFQFVGEDDLSGEPQKPYLTSLPGDYVGDLMVMEWLEYLVEESTTTDAIRAVNYYERVDWVDETVANQLKTFLSGFGDIDRNLMERPGTAELDLDHHTQSLKYIMQLTNATAESVVLDRWPQLSGGLHGPQR